MTDVLQAYARKVADGLSDPDKKQLRFNDIVRVAQSHYPSAQIEGVRELVLSCDKVGAVYVKGKPMWQTLEQDYAWMVAA